MKNVSFRWSKEQEKAFQSIKMLVTTTPVLGYYDPNKEVTIQVDASKNGLGATLMQEGKPAMFASRSLNKTEQQYAQIEKECLAIVFACERFHQFIYGKEQIKLGNDHKPLETILKKELLKAPRRLQRMLLLLQKYNLKVVFKKGEKMYISGILSRASLSDYETENLNYNIFEVDDIYEDYAV
ncbi:Retrovirus-related Pol polyprotein from transposon gypsy [Araneus ventricosus]|uniref:Retrovirus-related Pol polyprotein from transposon gypsy n=1 Tax=Araneus ventricosus TaxID=182803 RepID=A0A4Y2FYM7_ARAVE|nr:Retrovirus-related Pol polyprotein from transposon gypsy [Araneus ventricosus]